MKKCATLIFLLILSSVAVAQGGFQFDSEKTDKVVIPFQLIGNLIIIPIAINGIELNFLLDSGVDETVLFSLDEKSEASFFNVKKIKLTGLGSDQSIDALKSSENWVSFPGLSDDAHDFYIVLDENFNFSSNIGIPVNGIIGYQFFRNNLVEINYDKKKIVVYKENPKRRKRIKKRFSAFDITLEKNKPYVNSAVTVQHKNIPAKLLIDTGNSDAIWLFQNQSDDVAVPDKNFNDFLGRGFSGDIHGKRARIDAFDLQPFSFKNPLVAFPDTVAVRNISMDKKRLGSIGGEILKRFTVIFDYKNNKMYLKKGNSYDSGFHYNMSGVEIHHDGLKWVGEKVALNTVLSESTHESKNLLKSEFTYKFELKPVYAIANVRKDSPGDLCGLQKGDIIVSINGKSGYYYTLQEMNELFKSEEGKTVKMTIERKGIVKKVNFRLKNIL